MEDYFFVIWLLLALAHMKFLWTIVFHVWENDREGRWGWIIMFWFTGGLASYYYYFIYKRPKDLEKKKYGSG